MQDIIFYVSAKESLGVCKDSLGVQDASAPAIILGSKVRFRMRLLTGDGTNTPLPIAPLASCVSWEFVMDSDWNHTTPLKVVADNANIAVATVTETDAAGTEHTYTEVQIPVISINSAELQALLTSETATLNAELAGYDSSAELAYILQIKGFTVRNRIAASGPPTETEDLYLDEAEVRALLAGYTELAATPTAGNLLSTDAAGQAEDSGSAISTDGTFAANSDAKIPTEKAVKTALALKANLAYLGSAWYPITYAASASVDPANGPCQKIDATGALDITPPTLSAAVPFLRLQVDTGGYAISVSSAEIIATGTTAVYIIAWHWDGAATRRHAPVEVF